MRIVYIWIKVFVQFRQASIKYKLQLKCKFCWYFVIMGTRGKFYILGMDGQLADYVQCIDMCMKYWFVITKTRLFKYIENFTSKKLKIFR